MPFRRSRYEHPNTATGFALLLGREGRICKVDEHLCYWVCIAAREGGQDHKIWPQEGLGLPQTTQKIPKVTLRGDER